ncbi:MAG: hypothetical protein ACKV0T_30485 [Planctomycetales bacterium]
MPLIINRGMIKTQEISMGWQTPNNQLFSWMQQFCMRVGESDLPNIRGSQLLISSDYSFGSPKSDFDVIGLLIADLQHSYGYLERQTIVRKELLPDGRTMGFKSLNDRIRQQAFFPFLEAANQIEGICVAIAIDRRIEHLISTPDLVREFQGRDWLQSPWKPRVFEQLIRVAHFIAVFVAGLSIPNQNLWWFTDDDAIIPNDRHASDTGRIFTKFLNMYTVHRLGEIAIGRNSLDEDDCLLEDLGAIADLTAGSTAEHLTTLRRKYGSIPTGMEIDLPPSTARTENFLTWFEETNHPLRRLAVALYLNRNGHLAMTILRTRMRANGIVIPRGLSSDRS